MQTTDELTKHERFGEALKARVADGAPALHESTPDEQLQERRRRFSLRAAMLPEAMATLGLPRRVLRSNTRDSSLSADSRGDAHRAAAGDSIWAHGEPGRGKTHFAAVATRLRLLEAIRVKCLAENIELDEPTEPDFIESVVWAYAPAFDAAVRATYETGGNAQLLRRHVTCSWLVLDDVGGRMRPGAARDAVNIIEQRHAAGLPTLVTSNYSRTEFCQQADELVKDDGYLGARLFSRLNGDFDGVCVSGIDRRTAA